MLALSGCTSIAKLDVDVNEPIRPVRIDSYSLTLENMPGFLEPYFRDELIAALAARGATEVPANSEAEFVLRFERTPLTDEHPTGDQIGDRTGHEEPTRFIARVVLSVQLRGDRDATKLGSLSRVHSVTAGAYMHQRARAQIRDGFAQTARRTDARDALATCPNGCIGRGRELWEPALAAGECPSIARSSTGTTTSPVRRLLQMA